MRWTQTFIPTLKETPAEAEITSHKLLLRAGLVRKLTSGLYTFLPIGLRALRKVEQIVREEMNRAGALEVLMPILQPPEIWEKSGRYLTASDVLLKARDPCQEGMDPRADARGGHHHARGRGGQLPYRRSCPGIFYQIQTKFRDEIRPRFGLMRAKEFVMKDAYSFDATDEGAQVSYQKMYDAYARIFQRCGLNTIAVEADTGVIGGKFSHEFMVPAETGENEVAYCENCHYAANVEEGREPRSGPRHPCPRRPQPLAPHHPEKFPTPGVVDHRRFGSQAPYGVAADRQIKTLVYVADTKPGAAVVAGRRPVERGQAGQRLGHRHPPARGHRGNLRGPGRASQAGLGAVHVTKDSHLRGLPC